MTKKAGIIYMAIGVAIILIAVYAYKANPKTDDLDSGETVTQVPADGEAQDEKPVLVDDTGLAPVGSYEAYAPEKIAEKSTTSRVVLFFHASWCPTCRALEKNILANLPSIPGDVTILKVNYDDSSELKQKYGVTYQHTIVQVDGEGNMVKKWKGSPTLADLVQEVQ